jgi:hypothetical protein
VSFSFWLIANLHGLPGMEAFDTPFLFNLLAEIILVEASPYAICVEDQV